MFLFPTATLDSYVKARNRKFSSHFMYVCVYIEIDKLFSSSYHSCSIIKIYKIYCKTFLLIRKLINDCKSRSTGERFTFSEQTQIKLLYVYLLIWNETKRKNLRVFYLYYYTGTIIYNVYYRLRPMQNKAT